MTDTSVGVDAGQRDRSELEHLLGRAVQACGPAVLVCTHLVDGHWAGSLQLSGPAPGAGPLSDALGAAVTVRTGAATTTAGPREWATGAAQAVAELSGRTAGRAVVFGGQQNLVGVVDTDTVPVLSAVNEVVGIAGTPTAGTRLVTQDFVRPVLLGGRLVLQVRPIGPDGDVAPFEVPNPTACCAAHG